MKLKMTMNMDMGELGSQAIDVYAEETDGKFVTYSGTAGSWMKQEVESLQQYDGMSNMKIYLDNAGSLKLDGEEKIQSGDAYKMSGVISGDSIEKVINASGIMDSMTGQLGAGYGEMLKSMYSDMGDLPVTCLLYTSKKDYPINNIINAQTGTCFCRRTFREPPVGVRRQAGQRQITLEQTAETALRQ